MIGPEAKARGRELEAERVRIRFGKENEEVGRER
jgi:hypothetical protein